MEQNERQLFSLLSEITPLYEAPMREAKARQDALAKPPGSLGLLEDLSVQLAGITGHIKMKSATPAFTFLRQTTAWSARAFRPHRSRSRGRRPST